MNLKPTKTQKNIYFSLLVCCLVFPFNGSIKPVDVQSESSKKHVRWIGSFGSSNDLSGETGLTKSIVNFLFGKDEIKMIRPISMVVSSDGSLNVLDQGIGVLLRIDFDENEMNFVPTQNNTTFPSLVGICRNLRDDILFTDSILNQVFIKGSSSTPPVFLNKSLNLLQPTGIAFNFKTDQIWVVETAAHRIAVLDNTGKVLKYVGSRGDKEGQFNYPTFIWIDSDGMVYVVDSMNFRLQILNSEGIFYSMFGEAGDATGYFARPKGVATDSENNIYIVDALFHAVQIFTPEGHFVHTFGKQGRGNGEFWMPSGIYIDKSDKIYVADSYNARIQLFEVRGKATEGLNEN